MAKFFTLGKNERLKSRKQIDLLFSDGKKITVSPFRIFYLVSAQESPGKSKTELRFGIGVSAKNFKKAVDRNRIKRLAREAWRLQKKELNDKLKDTGRQLNVFFIYTGKELPDFKLVKDKVATALKKLLDKTDENTPANS